jgi:hypothetical protein
MNKAIMKACGFADAVKLIEDGRCPSCKKLIAEIPFRDVISKKEHKISGLCQLCQDKVFESESILGFNDNDCEV